MSATAALAPLTSATAAITGRSFFMGRIVLTARRPSLGNHPRSNPGSLRGGGSRSRRGVGNRPYPARPRVLRMHNSVRTPELLERDQETSELDSALARTRGSTGQVV